MYSTCFIVIISSHFSFHTFILIALPDTVVIEINTKTNRKNVELEHVVELLINAIMIVLYIGAS